MGVVALIILLAISIPVILHSLRQGPVSLVPSSIHASDGGFLVAIGLAISFLLIAVLSRGAAVPVLLMLAAAVGFFACWVREFTFLMRQPDQAFQGRHDKLIWALLLIVLPPVGLFAFWSYRGTRWPSVAKPDPMPGTRDFF